MSKTAAMRSHLVLALLAGLALAMALACAPKKSPGPPPAWLDPAAPKSDAQFFYGVGCAPREINNTWFQKATADERARKDLALNLNEYLLSSLGGDTTAARAVAERTLPERQTDECYLGADGQRCVRTRLPRELLPSPGPGPAPPSDAIKKD
jgi:hypothetical protein